jgi:hypothetical protein
MAGTISKRELSVEAVPAVVTRPNAPLLRRDELRFDSIETTGTAPRPAPLLALADVDPPARTVATLGHCRRRELHVDADGRVPSHGAHTMARRTRARLAVRGASLRPRRAPQSHRPAVQSTGTPSAAACNTRRSVGPPPAAARSAHRTTGACTANMQRPHTPDWSCARARTHARTHARTLLTGLARARTHARTLARSHAGGGRGWAGVRSRLHCDSRQLERQRE